MTQRVDARAAEGVVRAYHEAERLELQAISGRFHITTQEVERILWEWEPEVYPELRLEPTPTEIVAARDGLLAPSRLLDRDNPKLRWDRIAYRAGISVPEVRRLYEQVKGPGAARRSYTGKGRRFEGMDRAGLARIVSRPVSWVALVGRAAGTHQCGSLLLARTGQSSRA